MTDTDDRDRDHPDGAAVEAGLALARAFTGISVRAVAAAGDTVTVPQLRVLMLIAEAGRPTSPRSGASSTSTRRTPPASSSDSAGPAWSTVDPTRRTDDTCSSSSPRPDGS